ncbi:uncharacterized protein LOC115589840 isoform X2 [Sparus aurata]|uniref:uncharacterized protein LOC115589840 isoform X2 n=1 Tax=Sparus aurata TaxID=8175 RepID=UPI0011C10846|nr:uncharacterized protein LOC115589840 isoform X2 [Sparus aurata]
MIRLDILLLLVACCGDSVHPEERNNFSHDPLNPDRLQCPITTIVGKDGDTVILPCSTKDKMDISHEEVEWTFKDPTTGKDKVVHTYFQGEDFLYKQSDEFKDRTSLFKEELSSGNCSLSLLVTTSHDGSYRCFVPGNLPCNFTLKVLPEGEEDSSQKHQDVTESPDNPNSTDGQNNVTGVVVGGVLGVVALIIIITLAYRYREQLKNLPCSQRKPKNQQIYQDVPLQAQRPPQDEEKPVY